MNQVALKRLLMPEQKVQEFEPADEHQQANIVEIKTDKYKEVEAAAAAKKVAKEQKEAEIKEASANGSIFKGFCKFLAQCISDKVTEALK